MYRTPKNIKENPQVICLLKDYSFQWTFPKEVGNVFTRFKFPIVNVLSVIYMRKFQNSSVPIHVNSLFKPRYVAFHIVAKEKSNLFVW